MQIKRYRIWIEDSHSGDYEDRDVLGCSSAEVNRHFGQMYRLLVACFLSWTLKIEAIRSSKISVEFYQNSRLYNPEDRILLNVIRIHLIRLE
jgi:hypothetical protein